MRFDDIPDDLAECLACISTLASLGVSEELCVLLITRLKGYEGYYYVVSADLDEGALSLALGKCDIDPYKAAEIWTDVKEAWNEASQDDRDDLWRSTQYYKHDIPDTVRALVGMGFDITVDGIPHKIMGVDTDDREEDYEEERVWN